jgi:hypothetical protein
LIAAAALLALLLAQPAVSWADSCSSHAQTCHKFCVDKVDKGKCSAACDSRAEECKKTGIYIDATAIKHTVTERN